MFEADTVAARIGMEGEDRVAHYLKSKGYIIVKRNYRDRFGELDIIAEREDEIAFVEVKTRAENALVEGFEAVDSFKQKRLQKTGLLFLQRLHRELNPRFDVAQVTYYEKPDGSRGWRLCYRKNVF